ARPARVVGRRVDLRGERVADPVQLVDVVRPLVQRDRVVLDPQRRERLLRVERFRRRLGRERTLGGLLRLDATGLDATGLDARRLGGDLVVDLDVGARALGAPAGRWTRGRTARSRAGVPALGWLHT